MVRGERQARHREETAQGHEEPEDRRNTIGGGIPPIGRAEVFAEVSDRSRIAREECGEDDEADDCAEDQADDREGDLGHVADFHGCGVVLAEAADGVLHARGDDA